MSRLLVVHAEAYRSVQEPTKARLVAREMRFTMFLVLVTAFTLIAYTAGYGIPAEALELLSQDAPVGRQAVPPGRILLMSIPYAAHSLPLLRLATELAARGHNVTFSSSEDFLELPFAAAQDWEAMGVNFLPAGPPPLNATERLRLEQQAVDYWDSDPPRAHQGTITTIHEFHVSFVRNLLGTGRVKKGDFDLVVGELLTSGPVDIAQELEVPYVLVSPLFYIVLTHRLMRMPLYLSLPVSPFMLPYRMSTLQAVQHLATAAMLRTLVSPAWAKGYARARQAAGVVSEPFWDAYDKRLPPPLVLLLAAPGLEAPMALPPHVHMVGPMIQPSKPLSEEMRAWLEAGSGGELGGTVVYVGFGTVVNFKDPQYRAVLQALGSLAPFGVRALWSVRIRPGSYLEAVVQNGTVPPNVRLEPFVPQFEVLRHPAVRGVLNHGGYSSFMETLYWGKPFVGIPGFGDNDINTYRAAAKGAAIKLDRRSPTLETDIREALLKVLRTPSYTAAAQQMGLLVRMAPGASHAAHLMETTMLLGSTEHMDAPDNTVAVVSAALIIAAVPLLLVVLSCKLCMCMCLVRGKGRHDKPKKE